MKATKALKKLTKIEALIADVSERFSNAPHTRELLQDAKAAFARVKEAVSLHASSGTKTAAPTAHRAEKKAAPARKKAAVKKTAAKALTARTAKTSPSSRKDHVQPRTAAGNYLGSLKKE